MKKFIPILLIATLFLTTALAVLGLGSPSSEEEPAPAGTVARGVREDSREKDLETDPSDRPSEKEEVVYSILDFQGNPEEVYVVNSFTDASIIDYGRYSEISNMTSSEEIQVEGDRITIHTEEERFFYQGTLEDREMPWNISLSYHLDGEEISPEALEGATGRVEITIDVTLNDGVDPVFSNYYVMQIALMLDTEKFTDIQSPDGVFASAGRNRVINHTILPEEEARIRVDADVRDFSMKEIEFSALPFSMVFDDPLEEDLFDDFYILTDAVDGIYQGVKGLNRGIHDTFLGARALNEGNREIGEGLEALSENSDPLLDASRQIGDALQTISGELTEGAEMIPDFDDLTPFIESLQMIRELLDDGEWEDNPWAMDLDDLQGEFLSVTETMEEAVAALPDEEVDLEALYEAVEGDEELTESLDRLNDYYQSSRDVSHIFEEARSGFEDMEEQLEEAFASYEVILEELPEMIDEILEFAEAGAGFEEIDALVDGINELSQNYEQFHSGLRSYMNGLRDLSDGHREIQRGYESLTDGLGELNSGADELGAGTKEFSDAVGLLPDTIQEEINKLMAEFDYSDFEPRSFVSEKNTEVSLVQFVFKTPEIGGEEEENDVLEEPESLSFWQRLLDLFGLYDRESSQ
ncbi:hypothetical protein [Isachenkonia alkalipeptolytica]|uniref:Uncharacterized protein n=1 Tax=Isachenkonia alkalipeptolytica TaxID=2565777 RepID=A0AA43XLF3_9CLOT|nr:hypothetical protein [Isachenkonia alkalipeptolytica]NBG88822.1 hypothetical protein [Isachenkonia alkalipeptolytica]